MHAVCGNISCLLPQKIRVLPAVGKDPESQRSERIKVRWWGSEDKGHLWEGTGVCLALAKLHDELFVCLLVCTASCSA